MVQALLTSIKTMLGSQASQNKEFKSEAVRNNRNVSSALKDIYKMFSASKNSDAKQNSSLSRIEASTSETSDKVDRSNSLLQESISLQSQMLGELKGLARSFLDLNRNQNNTNLLNNNQNNPSALQRMSQGAALAAMGIAGIGAGTMNSQFFGVNTEPVGSGVGSSENAEKALEFFKSKGWSLEQSAGIVGNLQAESSQELNPSAIGDGGKAYGIAQWHPDRQANFERAFGKSIRQASFEEQLEFIQWELDNTESRAASILKNAKSAAEAAALFDQYYERSSGEHRGRRIANANRLIEGDETGTYQTASTGPQSTAMGSSGGSVHEKQSELAGIRKLPLNSKLKSVLQQAASAAGVDVVVYSGGQARKGEGGPRTGSTRHDHGNAADLYLMRGGKKLSDVNPEDRAIMAKFVSAAVAAGATGVGAGHNYMGPSNIHVGFGKPATWGGAGWIQQAATGVYSNKDLQVENTDIAGGYGAGGAGGAAGFGDSSGVFSSLGMLMGGTSMGAAGLLSAFFGLPIAGGFSEMTGQVDEANEVEPAEALGRSAGPGGPLIGSKEFEDYRNVVRDKSPKISSNERGGVLNKLETAALSSNVIVVDKPPGTTAYSQPPMKEARPDFGAVAESGSKETRASWAPRIAVLRPDDNAPKGMTWAARIRGNYA